MINPGRRAALTRAAGLSAVLLGTLIVPLDSSVNVDFPFITRHFGLPIPLIQWLVISYTLTSASLMLACGRAADLLGHRRVFLLGCAASTVAFVLCALAPGYGWLLGFRVLQGIGAGLVLSTGPALITSLYPEAKRPRALALYTAGFAIGGALGASLAGLLIARFGWSVVFWFRAPAAALAFGLGFFLERARRAQAERFDLTGALLLVGTIIALLLMLNRLRSVVLAAALAAVSIVGAWCFIRQERRVRHPIIDLALFRDRGFAAANLGNLLVNLAGFAVPLLVPFQLARLPGISITLVGMLLALSSVGMMLGAPLAGRLLAVMPARWLLPAGAVVVTVGLAGIGGLAGLAIGLAAAMLLQGVGQGVFQVAYFDLITATMPLHSRGVAGSLGMLTRTMGVVSGASLLMLGFQAIGGGGATDVAFAAGFRGAMLGAAALAAVVALGLALRGRLGSSGRCK